MTLRIQWGLGPPMRRRRVQLVFACLAAVSPLSGCVGVSRVATLPPDAGIAVRYHASIDEVATVVPQALNAVGQAEVERSRTDSTSFVMLGMRGFELFGFGEVSRTLASAGPQGGSSVRIIMSPRYIFDLWPPTKSTARTIAEIDRLLGPDQIALGVGDRVRGIGADGEMVEGILSADEAGTLTLNGDRADVPRLPLDALRELEIHRGTYGHSKAGFWIGAGIGQAVLFAAAVSFVRSDGSAPCLDPDPPFTCEFPIQSVVLAAPVLGALVGSAFRTSIWSSAAYQR